MVAHRLAPHVVYSFYLHVGHPYGGVFAQSDLQRLLQIERQGFPLVSLRLHSRSEERRHNHC